MAKEVRENEKKRERISRGAAANRVVAELNGKTTLGVLGKQADELFVEGGGESKPKAAAQAVRRSLETAEAMGLVKLTKPTDVIVQKVK